MRNLTRDWFAVVDKKGNTGWIVSVALGALLSIVELVAAGVVLIGLRLSTSNDPLSIPVIGDVRNALPGTSRVDDVRWFVAIAIAFFVCRAALIAGHAYITFRTAFATGVRASEALYARYLDAPFRWHLDQNTAKLGTDVTQTVQQFVVHVYTTSVTAASQAILVTVLLGAAVVASPLIALIAICLLGATAGLTLALTHNRLAALGAADLVEHHVSLQIVLESLGAIRDVKLFDLGTLLRSRFRRSRVAQARANYMRSTLAALPRMLIESSALIAVLLFLGVRGTQDERELARLGALAYIVLRTLPTLNSLITNLNATRYGRAALSTLAAGVRTPEDAVEFTDITATSLSPDLSLVDVSFGYSAHAAVLRDVSLTVPFGTSVGIVGSTGSGKSTLLDVLTGLLRPSRGDVLVDGRSLQSVAPAWFATVAVVPQTVMLLDAPLWENIAIGKRRDEVDEARLRAAIDDAQLGSIIGELPDGLETEVGERGVRLSGGQRQRVAIARALYRDPTVLILDEGTSALDNRTEEAVMATLSSRAKPRTLILVAHRLSTVERCDKIVVLEHGEVVAEGSYGELAQHSAAFQRLALLAAAPAPNDDTGGR